MMKKRDIPISKTVFSQLPPIGPEESTRPVALTPDPRSQQTDQRDDQFGLDLVAVTPQPPKRPQQNQPPNRSYSRHRPNQPLRQERPSEVPKMDFSSIEKLDDEPARLDRRPPKHPGHLTYAQVVKQDTYDEPQPSRHVDRGLTYVEQAYGKPGFHLPIIDASKQDSYVEPKPSRHVDHGLTYVEQAYSKPGFHLPIIDASKQKNIAKNIITIQATHKKKPQLINLDIGTGTRKPDIKFPLLPNRAPTPSQPPRPPVVEHMPNIAHQMSLKQRMTSPRPARASAAVEKLPTLVEQPAWKQNDLSPRPTPPKTLDDKLPTITEPTTWTYKAESPKKTRSITVVPKFPDIKQQTTFTEKVVTPGNHAASPDDGLPTLILQSVSPKQLSPRQPTAPGVQTSPDQANKTTQREKPVERGRPRTRLITVAAAYDPTDITLRDAVPRFKKIAHTPTPPNPAHEEPEKTGDTHAPIESPMIIGLEEIFLSPRNLQPIPSPRDPGDGQEVSQEITAPPKPPLSISEQIKAFKMAEKMDIGPRDMHGMINDLKLTNGNVDEKKKNMMAAVEEQRFKEQLLNKEMIPKPKPPHHLNQFVTGPFNVNLVSGECINVHPGAAKQPPASLRKRRQPRPRRQDEI